MRPTMISGRSVGASAAFLLLILAGNRFLRPSDDETPKIRHLSSIDSPSPNTLAAPGLGQAFRLGHSGRHIYSFDREILLKWQGAREQLIRYQGRLRVEWVQTSKNLSARFTLQLPSRDTHAGLHAELDAVGAVKSLHRIHAPRSDAEPTEEDLDLLKDLIAHWSFAGTEDTIGRYSARISLPDAGQSRMLKRKKGYVQVDSASPQVSDSEHWLHWDAKVGAPTRIHGEETLTYSTALITRSSYSFKHLREVKFEPDSLAMIQQFSGPAVGFDLAASPHPLPARPWPELKTELFAMERMSLSQRLALFAEITRAWKLNPGGIADARELALAAEGSAKRPFQILVGALATLGSAPAQSMLVEIYRDPRCDHSGREAILTAITTTEARLEPRTVGFLRAVAQSDSSKDLSESALFALGAELKRGDDPATFEFITARWKQARDTHSREVVLDAIGNSGNAGFTPILLNALLDASPSVRAKAVWASRFLDEKHAATLIGQGSRDVTAQVRRAAREAAEFQAL